MSSCGARFLDHLHCFRAYRRRLPRIGIHMSTTGSRGRTANASRHIAEDSGSVSLKDSKIYM